MTKKLYIGSVSSGVGKTAVALALGLIFQEQGLKIGYCKPISFKWTFSSMEKWIPVRLDAALFQEVLGLPEPLDLLAPAFANKRAIEQMTAERDIIHEKIMKAVHELCSRYEYLLLEDCMHTFYLNVFNLSGPDLARDIGAKMVVIDRCHDATLDSLMATKGFIESRGAECVGAIINHMPFDQQERIKGVIVPMGKKLGLEIWGCLPQLEKLTAPTVAQLAQWLNGEIITRLAPTSVIVEDFLVGAMQPDTALKMMRRMARRNPALITGGDRSDMALAAMEAQVATIILTGNLYPNVRVLNRAEELKIPVILIPHDTYTAVSILQSRRGTEITPDAKERIDAWKEVVAEEVDIDGLLQSL